MTERHALTGRERPHSPEDFLERVLPWPYWPGAECPTWQRDRWKQNTCDFAEQLAVVGLERDRWRDRAVLGDLERRFWRALCLLLVFAALFLFVCYGPWSDDLIAWAINQGWLPPSFAEQRR